MASSSAATPDTLVTIKVNIEGQNRRLKMPLRDLGANTLPEKLRAELHIPSSIDVLFERYSDSAAAFVTLDPNNPSVYKQLYRAAKAKLKLRIKATLLVKEPTSSPAAHQATVEDETPSTPAQVPGARPVEDAQPASAGLKPLSSRKIVSLPVAHTPSTNKASPPPVAQIQRGVADLLLSQPSRQSILSDLDQIMNDVTTSYKNCPADANKTPVGRGADGRRDYFAGLLPDLKLSNNLGKAVKAAEDVTASCHKALQDLPAMEMPLKHCPYAQANSSFTVFCNHCSAPILNNHYHCGVCDDGDFDLCMDCIGKGFTCFDESHWLIKRSIENGKVSSSVTETLAPKSIPTYQKADQKSAVESESEDEEGESDVQSSRTCNACIQEFPDENFVTCTVCEDYDLCIPCHVAVQHGHDPKHAFEAAVQGAVLEPLAITLLKPGRFVGHHAICDGCDKYVYGVRHKCLDCPDWDYCSSCIKNSKLVHPGHRFVPIYEPLGDVHESLRAHGNRVKHFGIYCDGPLCRTKTNDSAASYIVGDRYKCAVCHDTDFCAACEASPMTHHNKTHPLIKFKTMIRNVSVTTMGDHVDGQRMKVMGDRLAARHASKATETTPARSANAATQVQTVADLRPTERGKSEEIKVEAANSVKAKEVNCETVAVAAPVKPQSVVVTTSVPVINEELIAHFVRDTVTDGTTLPPSHVFEQTWFLRNSGTQAWPARCSVKFVGGDNMCAVDPEHPASVLELVSAAESTVCHTEVAPGQEASFTVLMRTPSRPGKAISYWRLTGPDAMKFGHRLWCDVNVCQPIEQAEDSKVGAKEEEQSKMVFPKLEKESPASSVHESAEELVSKGEQDSEAEELEDFLDEDEHDFDDETEDGFFTDEEYDILDASDEEYLKQQPKGSMK